MGSSARVNDLLPDISLLASSLNDAYVSTSNSELPTGTRGLRFTTASVNYGAGRFEIQGGTISGTTQLVNQRVYRSDGSSWTRPCGTFVYHSTHGHLHFDNWTVFRLRTVLPANGVGPIVAQGAKTSFCILEINQFDVNAPGHNDAPAYGSCGQLQGLRPGWSDVYGSGLSGQVIDLTGVADGTYWLEGEVDPSHLVLESDTTNNVVRVQVVIGTPPTATPDAYEENDTRAVVNARTVGATNSPNVGLVLNTKVLSNLSMDDTNDWFKIKIHAGAAGSFIQMVSPYQNVSDLDLQICDLNGVMIRESVSNISVENISLSGLPAGDYFVRVFPYGAPGNPVYNITISPTPNTAPILALNSPIAGTRFVEKSYETFPVSWNGSDPDNDPKIVSIMRSRTNGVTLGSEIITGYQNMPNPNGLVNMNTAEFPLGKWFIYGVGTDGGAQTISWAPGAVNIYLKGDMNGDGLINKLDLGIATALLRRPVRQPAATILDMDRNGKCDKVDLELLLDYINDHD